MTATASDVTAAIGALKRAREWVASRSRRRTVAVLDDVVDAWLAPGSPWFARAVALLPGATGFSPEMVRHALPTMLEPLRRPALAALLADEVGERCGPPLIFHVLPGNLPGLAAIPTALSLAIGSATLLKAGRGDRVFPGLFAQSIAERDPELGAAVAALYWPGGDRACEDAALGAANLVVASGDDATVADLAARTRRRFIGHGHRISFAVVAREVAADAGAGRDAAERLAEDVAIWDQRGCLSPQLCFVEGSIDAAVEFGSRVADALRSLAARLPAAEPDGPERMALRRFRDEAEWRGLSGAPTTLFAPERDRDGTVVVEADVSFHPTPLGRCVRVQPLPDAAALAPILQPVRAALEGAGLAAGSRRWPLLAEQLAASGVHRVSRLGDMQRPPLAWRQGGRPRVGDWALAGPSYS